MSDIAAFPKYHFYRQFTATFGLSVHSYVKLARKTFLPEVPEHEAVAELFFR